MAVSAASCGGDRSGSGGNDEARLEQFADPDGWWTIELPGRWQKWVVLPNGARYPVTDKEAQPTRTTPTGSLDPDSLLRVYDFYDPSADPSCRDCEPGAHGRMTVSASTLRDASADADAAAAGLREAPGVTGIELDGRQCPEAGEASCTGIAYSTPQTHVEIAFLASAQQRRSYQVKVSADAAAWESSGADLLRYSQTFRVVAQA